MRWMIASLCCLGACAGTTMDDTGTGGTTDAMTGDSGKTYADDGGTQTDGTIFEGLVVDSSRTPVEGANIKFCQVICLTGETDANGRFRITNAPAGWTAFEVIPPDSTGLSTGYIPVVMVDGEDRDETMILPTDGTAQSVPATATEVEVGQGMFVTLLDDELEAPPFVDDATEVSGVLVDGKDYPPLADWDGGNIVALWFMNPFDHFSKAGMPVEFANQWTLADGEVYEVWQGQYDVVDAPWVLSGQVTVSGDRLAGDAELGLLSTTLLVGPIAAE